MVLPPSVIPFWKPLMTPNLNPNSDVKILQIFLQPIFATQEYENFQRPYPQVLYLFGNLSWPLIWISTQMPNFCKFFATLICKPRIWKLPEVLYLFGNLSQPPTWIPTEMPKFCIFLATHLLKIRILKLPEVLPPNVIPFWNTRISGPFGPEILALSGLGSYCSKTSDLF